jgi:hypothetical protein
MGGTTLARPLQSMPHTMHEIVVCKLGNGAETWKACIRPRYYGRERWDVPMWAEGPFCSIELVTFKELLKDWLTGVYLGRASLTLYARLPNESATIGESDRHGGRMQRAGEIPGKIC